MSLDPKTLQVKDWFTQPGVEFVTGPTVFRHNDQDIVAAATKDGRVLLDAASLGGANHSTPLYRSRAVTGGGSIAAALATWQEMMIAPAPPAPPPVAGAPPAVAAAVPPTVVLGARWILVPIAGRAAASVATNGAVSTGAVVALKLGDAGGVLSLEPAWTSHNLTAPATPIIVNGVTFALSSGRPSTATGRVHAAVLYAYDGATGRGLWNSATSMATFASPGSYWSALGQVYVGTHDVEFSTRSGSSTSGTRPAAGESALASGFSRKTFRL